MSSARIVVVTGGAAGIGAAIAESLGAEGAFVITMDPVVSLDGVVRISAPDKTTAERIIDAGGMARASSVSVTDQHAVQELFAGLVDEFGAIDAVVNVAGISRPTDFAGGTETDWAAVLNVHLEGYLNVLRAALPLMEKSGYGRVVGVTSGSGWRAANTGAYGCAKRAVASLTWQLGPSLPSGVTVNALSPIAATRMVTAALSRRADSSAGATGGLSLGSMPPPENLGPIGAHLASDRFGWCSGKVIFSNGAEVALIAAPHLLEVVRSRDVASLPQVLREVLPRTFVEAEAAQASSGGTNPRFGPIFDKAPDTAVVSSPAVRSCLVVTDDEAWRAAVRDSLSALATVCVGEAKPTSALAVGFDAAAAHVSSAAAEIGDIDSVIVALRGGAAATSAVAGAEGWQRILDEHRSVCDDILIDAGWVRAVAEYSRRTNRPVRVVTVTQATSAGGRSRAQASAQLARSAQLAMPGRVDAIAVSVETTEDVERRSIADLVVHLATGADSATLSGAEIVAASGWFGLRGHPTPTGSIAFGGPEIPDWLDAALQQVVGTHAEGGVWLSS